MILILKYLSKNIHSDRFTFKYDLKSKEEIHDSRMIFEILMIKQFLINKINF